MSHFSLCLNFPFPHFYLPLKLSHVSLSDQLLPSAAHSFSLTCSLFPQLPKLKERSGGREESRGERLHGTGWGENEVSYAEEQMEGAVGDRAWVNSRENLKGFVR